MRYPSSLAALPSPGETAARQMLEDFDAASACYQEAMAVQPKWADSYFGLGEICARKGQWEQSVQWGEIGIQRVMAGDGITDKSNFVNANAYNFAPYVWLLRRVLCHSSISAQPARPAN